MKVYYKLLLKRPHSLSLATDIFSTRKQFRQLYKLLAWTLIGSSVHFIESVGTVLSDTVVNPSRDKLVGHLAQDWIAGRLHLRDQLFHSYLFPVTPAINHARGTRVSVPAPRTNLEGCRGCKVPSHDLGDCREAHEKYTMRSLTGEPPQLLKDMGSFRCLFWSLVPSWSVAVVSHTYVAFIIPCSSYYHLNS